ncbi:MAG: ATP-binding protein [Bdellovibrionales bacterium]
MNTFSHLTNGYTKNENIKIKIAIMGAPGSGKSTLSAGLLYFSKMFGFRVDAVPEVAKWHIYKGSDFNRREFEYEKFEEQKELENIYPRDLEVTICEAPLIISAVYAEMYHGTDSNIFKDMKKLAEANKDRYTHFLVSRKLKTFESFGRRENESQSDKIHEITLKHLEDLGVNYTVVNRYDDHIPLQTLAAMGAIYRTEKSLMDFTLDSLKSLDL